MFGQEPHLTSYSVTYFDYTLLQGVSGAFTNRGVVRLLAMPVYHAGHSRNTCLTVMLSGSEASKIPPNQSPRSRQTPCLSAPAVLQPTATLDPSLRSG